MILPSIPNLKEINDKFENGTSTLSKDSFTFIVQIGSGAFGKVYKVSSKLTNKLYALKVLSKNQLNHLKLMDQLKNEISIFSRCNHENIIRLYGAFEDANYIYQIMELANDSNLFNKLKKQKKFNDQMTFNYLRDIISALIYLHSQNPVILHRDLKPENILLHDGKCKLSDFGWSNVDDEFRNTFCGTPDYLAPEMILGSGHTDKLDIWTIGILMYELMHGKPPFSPKEKIADGRMMQKMIEKNILKGQIEFADHITPEAQETIKSLLNSDEAQRPPAKLIFDLSFFKKYMNPTVEIKTLSVNNSNQSSVNNLDDATDPKLKKQISEYKSRLEILLQQNKKTTTQLETTETSLKMVKKELEFEKIKNKKLNDEIVLIKTSERKSDQNSLDNELKEVKLKSAHQDESLNYLLKRSMHFSHVIDEFFEDFILEKTGDKKDLNYDNSLMKIQAIFRDFIRYKNFVEGKNVYNPYELKTDGEEEKSVDIREKRIEVRKTSPVISLDRNKGEIKLSKSENEFWDSFDHYFNKS